MSAVGILLLSAAADAAVPRHLDEMPGLDRVLAVRGRDRLDTAARQVVILQQLIYMVATLSDGRHSLDQLTPDERRIVKTYADAIAGVEARTLASFGVEGSHGPQAEETWGSLRAGYAADDRFRRAVLEQFFSRQWQESYRAVEAHQPPGPAPRSLLAGFLRSVLMPVAALAAAAFGVFFIARTVVRRRRAARLEQEDGPYVDVLEASARQALRDLRRSTALSQGRRSRR